MKPLYLKIKEVNLRLVQVSNRKLECTKSLKAQSAAQEHLQTLQNNSMYYSVLERGFSLFERYEAKFLKVKEFEAKNNFIMVVQTLDKIEEFYTRNIRELSDFPDLARIVKAKINSWKNKTKINLEERIITVLFQKIETKIFVEKNYWNEGD